MKRARIIGLGIACVVTILTLATPAHAYTMGDKACRGAAGMFGFVLELPGNMVDLSNQKGVWPGAAEGFVKGIVMMPIRGMIGVYELFTFPFDIQKGYEPVMEPDYPWGYFSKKAAAPKVIGAKK